VHKLIFSVTTSRVSFFFFFSFSFFLPFFLARVRFSCWIRSRFVFFSFSLFVLAALVFVLTLIFTVNTCIVLFLQLQSAPPARRAPLENFCLFRASSPLSREAVSLAWIFFSLFFFFYLMFLSLYRVFFVGTRGYVRQRRVITLNNAARRVATGLLSPTDADCGVIEKRGNAG
jgi:hypothetical protein